MDVTVMDIQDLFEEPDVIWASPPCTTYSVASIGAHWTGGHRKYVPKTEAAKKGIEIVKQTLQLINDLAPGFWFVENPRGVLRKMPFMKKHPRVTITYCQYGDARMKPTDIWGNRVHELLFRPMCKNGDPCHERAPRGSHQGTEGLKNAVERSRIPPALGRDLCQQIERRMSSEPYSLNIFK